MGPLERRLHGLGDDISNGAGESRGLSLRKAQDILEGSGNVPVVLYRWLTATCHSGLHRLRQTHVGNLRPDIDHGSPIPDYRGKSGRFPKFRLATNSQGGGDSLQQGAVAGFLYGGSAPHRGMVAGTQCRTARRELPPPAHLTAHARATASCGGHYLQRRSSGAGNFRPTPKDASNSTSYGIIHRVGARDSGRHWGL